MPCTVGQPPVIVGQPDCYTWLPSGQPPSNQIWQALYKCSHLQMHFIMLFII